jgi:NitT/TauT family transport system ATP-binding protein
MAAIAFNNVGKVFPLRVNGTAKTVRALDGVSFEVAEHEVVALLGPSGCGKTTALRITMGLETATSGRVLVGGREVTGCGHDRGMVFQHAELLPWCTALENIKFGLRMKGVAEPELTERARRYLDLVGLSHAAQQRPHQLSGGMQQRVGIARALAIDPEILLMDEPFGALDSQTREGLQSELLGIHAKTKKTIIFVTHDLDEAVVLANRIVVMEQGRVRDIVSVPLGTNRRSVRELRGMPEFTVTRASVWEKLHSSGAEGRAEGGMR